MTNDNNEGGAGGGSTSDGSGENGDGQNRPAGYPVPIFVKKRHSYYIEASKK